VAKEITRMDDGGAKIRELLEDAESAVEAARAEALRQLHLESPSYPTEHLRTARDALQRLAQATAATRERIGPDLEHVAERSEELAERNRLLPEAQSLGLALIRQKTIDVQIALGKLSEEEGRQTFIQQLEQLADQAVELENKLAEVDQKRERIAEDRKALEQRRDSLLGELPQLEAEVKELPKAREIEAIRDKCVELAAEVHDLTVRLRPRVSLEALRKY
jgi:chromosome segregation ATPase